MESLLLAKGPEEFMQACRKLATEQGRAQLLSNSVVGELILPLEALFTDDEVELKVSTASKLAEALRITEEEDVPERLIHRLQLAGGCNPGMKSQIDAYLQRVCV